MLRLMQERPQLFEADPLHNPHLSTAMLSRLRPSTGKQDAYPEFNKLSWLWDVNVAGVAGKEGEAVASGVDFGGGEWQALYDQLSHELPWDPNDILKELPLGLRNRRRIWRSVEDLLRESTDDGDGTGIQIF